MGSMFALDAPILPVTKVTQGEAVCDCILGICGAMSNHWRAARTAKKPRGLPEFVSLVTQRVSLELGRVAEGGDSYPGLGELRKADSYARSCCYATANGSE